jgi:adenine-specific DNA methylase
MGEPEEFPIERSFIEETFPVKEVSEESAREKNIRHGHISTLHIWWARRPLAASRATAYAALIPAPKDVEEAEKVKQFIAEICKWENSLNPTYIEKARKDIRKALGYTPRVLDPFAGGGAIPLEALRLGCETYASDYNPVAVLILKAVLEYPQKYGEKLVEDVRKWGEWVLEEAKKEIGRFYPNDVVEQNGYFGKSGEEYIPVGYIWARTIPCQNPSCGAEIPLMRQFWLAKKSNKKVALYTYVDGEEVKFKVVGDGYEPMPEDFDPSKGTVKGAIATCLVCGSTVDAKTTRKLFQEGKAGERMVAVVLHHPKKKGKFYRVANEKDIEVFRQAEEYLAEKVEELRKKWGIEPIPDEPLRRVPITFGVINVWVYGMNTWGDLFNSRQKLALITFVDKVREAYRRMVEEGYEEEYARGVVTYLGLAVDKIADYCNTICQWRNNLETVGHIFARQAIQMMWDYVEGNPVTGASGTWRGSVEWILRSISFTKIFSIMM